MTQLIPDAVEADAADGFEAQHRAGVVFVPCAICRAPLDLSLLCDDGMPRMCEHHLVRDGLPLQ